MEAAMTTSSSLFPSFQPRLIPGHGFFSSGRHFSQRRPLLPARASSASDPCRPIDVIGIGSRKDALIDFCLARHTSLPSSSPLRFWTIQWSDSQKAQLLQRCHETDVVGNVEFVQLLHQQPPAVILLKVLWPLLVSAATVVPRKTVRP